MKRVGMRLILAVIVIVCLATAFLIYRIESTGNRRVAIGMTGLTVEIPKYLTVEQEEPDILMAYIGETNLANIRFTVLDTLKNKGSNHNSLGTATQSETRHRVYRIGGKTVEEWERSAAYEKDATMRFWRVVYGKRLLLISCYYANSNRYNRLTQNALGAVPGMILSIDVQK